MTTKKCLVAFDPKTPHARSSDFLVPVWDGEVPKFFGIDSGKLWPLGRVVFVGQEITVNDIFAKLVDSGRRIESVDRVLKEIEAYISMVEDQRIGSVLELRADPSAPVGVVLSRTDIKAQASPKKKLP